LPRTFLDSDSLGSFSALAHTKDAIFSLMEVTVWGTLSSVAYQIKVDIDIIPNRRKKSFHYHKAQEEEQNHHEWS
jgi:hypothetical protein